MRQIELEGVVYPSLAAAAKALKITISTIEARLGRGWTVEQAFEIERAINHKSVNCILERKGIQERVCALCKEQKNLSEFYPRKSSKGKYSSRCKICVRLEVRNNSRVHKYNLNLENWNKLFKSQDNKCAICGSVEHKRNHWSTDHDHKTNKVRGILCGNCNSVLGFAEDNIKILELAILYLQKNSDDYIDVEEVS
jgi:hypothetical protein